jgi:hypothetical protein
MVLKLLKFNSWYAFACGIFCLMVADLIVDQSLISMGVKAQRIFRDETYLLAVSFVRVIGVALFAYAMLVRLLLRRNFDPENLRAFFGLFAAGAVLWGGMFLFLTFTGSLLLSAIAGIGLLEWLLTVAVLLFEYNKPQRWQSVRPGDRNQATENPASEKQDTD